MVIKVFPEAKLAELAAYLRERCDSHGKVVFFQQLSFTSYSSGKKIPGGKIVMDCGESKRVSEWSSPQELLNHSSMIATTGNGLYTNIDDCCPCVDIALVKVKHSRMQQKSKIWAKR